MVATFIITASMFCFVFIVNMGLSKSKRKSKKGENKGGSQGQGGLQTGHTCCAVPAPPPGARVRMLEKFARWFGDTGAYTHTCPWTPRRGLERYSEGLR